MEPARAGSAVLLRLKYTALTLAALAVTAFGAMCFAWAFLVLTGVLFHGSTGDAHWAFVKPFVPIGYFGLGALAAGGAVALVNAIARPRPAWFKTIAAIAVLGGLIVALNPALGLRLVDLGAPVFVAVMRQIDGSARMKEEQALAMALVQRDPAVAKAVGEKFRTSVSQTTVVDGKPVRYEIYVQGERIAFAIVSVDRSFRGAALSLACVTFVSPGARPQGDPCKQ
jgi:hypothetical protein